MAGPERGYAKNLARRGRCPRPCGHDSPGLGGPRLSPVAADSKAGASTCKEALPSLCIWGTLTREDAQAQPQTPGSLPLTLLENLLPGLLVGHQGRGWPLDILGEGVRGAAGEQPLANFAEDGQQQRSQRQQQQPHRAGVGTCPLRLRPGSAAAALPS